MRSREAALRERSGAELDAQRLKRGSQHRVHRISVGPRYPRDDTRTFFVASSHLEVREGREEPPGVARGIRATAHANRGAGDGNSHLGRPSAGR